MFVRQLIGRQAGVIVEMPYHAASSGLSMGTCASVTEDEIREAGLEPLAISREAEPEAPPPGYEIRPDEVEGFNLFDPNGEQLNVEPFPNMPAARGAAFAHAEGNKPASDEPLDLPEGWRDLHFSKIIALGRKLNAEVSTKAEAIAAIEVYEAAKA